MGQNCEEAPAPWLYFYFILLFLIEQTKRSVLFLPFRADLVYLNFSFVTVQRQKIMSKKKKNILMCIILIAISTIITGVVVSNNSIIVY